MKKLWSYGTMSTRKCTCSKFIKQNRVDRLGHRDDLVCFKCFQKRSFLTENIIRTAREVRNDPNLRSLKRIDKLIPLRRAYY
jgi:hypothetical protein